MEIDYSAVYKKDFHKNVVLVGKSVILWKFIFIKSN